MKLPVSKFSGGTGNKDDSIIASMTNMLHQDLQNIGLDKVAKLEKMYGPHDLRVVKERLNSFFRAYAILGTVRYAAQVCGLNPHKVKQLVQKSDKYSARFEQAHDEFCQYLEQTAVARAVTKSDQLLMFLLRANNPRKFSEKLRLQAITMEEKDDSPVQLVFGESSGTEPNYALPEPFGDEEEEE